MTSFLELHPYLVIALLAFIGIGLGIALRKRPALDGSVALAMNVFLNRLGVAGFCILLLLCLCACAGCSTNPTTGKTGIDPGKVAAYVNYAKAFNSGLTIVADTAAAIAPGNVDVKAGVAAAKAAIAVANTTLGVLEAAAQSAESDTATVVEAQAKAQGAIEAANAATGAISTAASIEQ